MSGGDVRSLTLTLLSISSDSEMAKASLFATDSPSPLVKFDLNDHHESEEASETEVDEATSLKTTDNADKSIKIEKSEAAVSKKASSIASSFLYPKLNFFSNSSNVVADSTLNNHVDLESHHHPSKSSDK